MPTTQWKPHDELCAPSFSLSGVADQLGLSAHEVLPSLTALLHTFRYTHYNNIMNTGIAVCTAMSLTPRLNRHTITYRPSEWRVILLVLLQRCVCVCVH